MVKTPRTRHSKPQRDPVTIELTANESSSAPSGTNVVEEEFIKPAALESEQASQTYAEQAESEALSQPVEDRIEDEAAATGRIDGNLAGPSREESHRRTEPAPAPSAGSRGGWGSHLVAGLVGGAIAAVASWALPARAPSADAGDFDAVRGEVSALRTEIDALKTTATDSAMIASSVEQMKGEIAALQLNIQSGAADATAMSGVADRLTQLDAAVAALTAANGQSTDLAGRIDALEQTVTGLNGKVAASEAQPKIALAIASAALKSAVERGVSFSAELETFAAIAPASPQFEALRAHASAGVPSRSDIAKAFPAAADAMAAAADPTPDDAGFFQRLLGSAESVIKVRPVGEVAG